MTIAKKTNSALSVIFPVYCQAELLRWSYTGVPSQHCKFVNTCRHTHTHTRTYMYTRKRRTSRTNPHSAPRNSRFQSVASTGLTRRHCEDLSPRSNTTNRLLANAARLTQNTTFCCCKLRALAETKGNAPFSDQEMSVNVWFCAEA